MMMPESGRPMYVGYLDAPARHRRFVMALVPALVVLIGGAGALIAASHRDPGPAVWDTSREREWTGTVRLDPFPMLVDGDGVAWLVVGVGKFGVRDRLATHDGLVRTLRGFPLERESRRMIELADAEDAVSEGGAAAADVAEVRRLGEVTLTSEIVDGKCFLGAMKPGDGKAHKACAILCLRGGLPPLLASEVGGEEGLYPLLVVDGSTDLSAEVLELVARRVRITGDLSMEGGLPVLRTSADRIAVVR